VRENRTPGSVRGLSGNWQSYRDQPLSEAPTQETVHRTRRKQNPKVPILDWFGMDRFQLRLTVAYFKVQGAGALRILEPNPRINRARANSAHNIIAADDDESLLSRAPVE